ncbi:MAG: hypothetical protein C0410_11115 [Anaerolinea sp.]|nr:hypothetical protein [Anaerolinea sp.]
MCTQRLAFAKLGAKAGVDSAWEQEKLEAKLREMLVNRAESQLVRCTRCWAILTDAFDIAPLSPAFQINHSPRQTRQPPAPQEPATKMHFSLRFPT